MNVTDILVRAGRLCTPEVTIPTLEGIEWINDCLDDIGGIAGPELDVVIKAVAGTWNALPPDTVAVLEVHRNDGAVYALDYEVRSGNIRFPRTGTYRVRYRRMPGPVTHDSDDFLNVLTVAEAQDEPSVVLLANTLRTQYEQHRQSLRVHNAVDVANALVNSEAISLVAAQGVLNELKQKFNAHREAPNVHRSPDPRNWVISPNATDLESAITLANELHKSYSDHLLSGLVHEAYHRSIALFVAARFKMFDNPENPDAQRLMAEYAAARERGFQSVTAGSTRVKAVW